MASWFVYVLECGDGSYYAGTTNDVDARVATHSRGKGSKYVRSRLPVRVAYVERAASKGAALSREAAIKRMTREEKRTLVTPRKPQRARSRTVAKSGRGK